MTSSNDIAPKVLVVEDDQRVGAALVKALGNRGYPVDWAQTGAEALAVASVDVVLLDLGLPDVDGLEVCRQLRDREPTPGIIAVTARGDSAARVAGLRTGADDYVVKPFSLAELTARIDAVWRRLPEVQPKAAVVTAGRLVINNVSHVVTFEGREINTTRKEFGLLTMLASDPNRVWSREELLEGVWQTTWRGKTRTVDVHVAVLRQKLGCPEAIRTVHGVGYQLAGV